MSFARSIVKPAGDFHSCSSKTLHVLWCLRCQKLQYQRWQSGGEPWTLNSTQGRKITSTRSCFVVQLHSHTIAIVGSCATHTVGRRGPSWHIHTRTHSHSFHTYRNVTPFNSLCRRDRQRPRNSTREILRAPLSRRNLSITREPFYAYLRRIYTRKNCVVTVRTSTYTFHKYNCLVGNTSRRAVFASRHTSQRGNYWSAIVDSQKRIAKRLPPHATFPREDAKQVLIKRSYTIIVIITITIIRPWITVYGRSTMMT